MLKHIYPNYAFKTIYSIPSLIYLVLKPSWSYQTTQTTFRYCCSMFIIVYKYRIYVSRKLITSCSEEEKWRMTNSGTYCKKMFDFQALPDVEKVFCSSFVFFISLLCNLRRIVHCSPSIDLNAKLVTEFSSLSYSDLLSPLPWLKKQPLTAKSFHAAFAKATRHMPVPELFEEGRCQNRN